MPEPPEPPFRRTPALAPGTVAVTAGRPPRTADNPLNVPPVLASVFHAGGELEYGRTNNPTWSAFEDALGALEGGEAVAFSSGLAAIAAVLDLVPLGGVVVAPRHSYSGTLALLRDLTARGRVRCQPVDIIDQEAVEKACSVADLVWLESPTNPALEVVDVSRIAATAHGHDAVVAVDNTFATPLLARPLADGADVVVHSATKYLAGHSDVLMGAAVSDEERAGRLRAQRSMTGAVPGTFEAWLALRGMRTLHLRVERAQANARELAGRLSRHSCVTQVRWPGFGAIVCIELIGGAPAADELCNNVDLWVHATSLGGVESTIERRRRWPAEALTIPEGLLRLSVGIEDVEDLWHDLDNALAAGG